ncbi:MAG: hypothetical protein GEU99_20395 [Luteitalea sp.]|nr:hypothetical protein [Luteitalea sp.]
MTPHDTKIQIDIFHNIANLERLLKHNPSLDPAFSRVGAAARLNPRVIEANARTHASMLRLFAMTRLQRRLSANDGKPLLGVAAYFYDPIFIEIAAHVGYDAAWIEMEHAPISFAEAADLCRIAQALGLLTMIRVPDYRRESVLKAAECGPDIIDVPMANSPEVLQGLVAEARFAPLGARGTFSVSRAMRYGLVENLSEAQQQINGERYTW